jgi:DNA (cytosine-5)-methyltransferase 1
MRILNLYSGIGGNRKLWPEDVEVTAVENSQELIDIYQSFFPKDVVINGDAKEILVRDYKNYDFIWSSPPCQSHSKLRYVFSRSKKMNTKPILPDMSLWAEIIFLTHYVEHPWVVENVKPYYDELIPHTQKLGRHYFWSNFQIPFEKFDDKITINTQSEKYFDLKSFKTKQPKNQILRNCVNPLIGEYIYNIIK